MRTDGWLQAVKASPAPLGPSSAEARCLMEARKSKVEPATKRVRCRACGVAFVSYSSLAQHLGTKHDGINSDEAKFRLLKREDDVISSNTPPVLAGLEEFPSLSAAKQQQQPAQKAPAVPPAAAGSSSNNSGATAGDKKSPHLVAAGRASTRSMTLADLLIRPGVKKAEKSSSKLRPASVQSHSAAAQKPVGGARRAAAMPIPEGLRLRGLRKPRLSLVKQQVLRQPLPSSPCAL